MRGLILGILVSVALVGTAQAQVIGTSQHRLVWDQPGTTTGLTFEAQVDGGVYAPVLGAACAASVCRGDLPTLMAAGPHAIILRAVQTVDGVRLTSDPSAPLDFVFVTNPARPGNPRLEPPGATVAALGTVRERYPFTGLDVARVWLDSGADVYIGAQRLTADGYTVQPGDRAGVVFYRP